MDRVFQYFLIFQIKLVAILSQMRFEKSTHCNAYRDIFIKDFFHNRITAEKYYETIVKKYVRRSERLKVVVRVIRVVHSKPGEPPSIRACPNPQCPSGLVPPRKI